MILFNTSDNFSGHLVFDKECLLKDFSLSIPMKHFASLQKYIFLCCFRFLLAKHFFELFYFIKIYPLA